MEEILKLLRPILPYLALAEVGLRNFDTNNTGTDDKAADAIREAGKVLSDLINENSTPSNVAKGLKAITAFGTSVVSALELLVDDPAPQAEREAVAQALVDSLSDPSKVFQAQRGDDAEALTSFKVKAGKLLLKIQKQSEAA